MELPTQNRVILCTVVWAEGQGSLLIHLLTLS